MSVEIISSIDELGLVYSYLNDNLEDNSIIFLNGDLASGKTTLTSYIVKAKNLSDGATSPTFSLQNSYDDKLFHYDLYRKSYNEFMEMGLFEEFEKSGWHIVEWGSDSLQEFLQSAGYNLITIDITPLKDKRKYIIKRD